MTKEENRKAAMDVIYLAGCALNGIKPDLSIVEKMDLDNVYHAAEFHLLTGITAVALQSAGIRDERFVQAHAKAVRKVLMTQADMEDLFERLEEEGIWYMPLKGSILSGLYPAIGMRQMADRDILFDKTRAGDIRDIMESLGFTTEAYGKGSHDVYHKLPVSNFEMHRELFGETNDPKVNLYYQSVKDRLVKDEGNKCGYHFKDEDAYIYMIAHEHKHYILGGTGLRSLMDTYIFCNRLGASMDWQYIEDEMTILGITEFEKNNRRLAMHLFDYSVLEKGMAAENTLTNADWEMLEYIIGSGTYGILDNSVQNKVTSFGGGKAGKARYFIYRIFLPKAVIKSAFPLFYKHKLLLPFLPIYRICKGILFRKDHIRDELKALRKSQ